MNQKRKPVIGEILYDLNVGNAAGRGREQVLTPRRVTKVGRKYFTCETLDPRPYVVEFHIDSWRQKSEYSQDHELWESPEAWEEARTVSKKLHELQDQFRAFGTTRFTNDQVHRMHAILKEGQP